MQYTHQRKPLLVEAWRNDDAGPAMPRWLSAISTRQLCGEITFPVSDKIETAQLGDWVVLKPGGTIAVMTAEAFNEVYDPIEVL